MKRFILSILFCIPLVVYAQKNANYLEGAITQTDGKVTLSTEINAPKMSKAQIYESLLNWANKRFQPSKDFKARVLYQNPEEGTIAIGGDEFIIFSSTALTLDRSRIYYQLLINCEEGKCNVDMTRIRYWYGEEDNGGEKYDAEEWITDDIALNKSKTKLSPVMGKFRRKTIDLKNELFKEIRTVLGAETPVPANEEEPAQPQAVPAQAPVKDIPAQSSNHRDGLIKQAVRITVTAGNDEEFEMNKDSWGGFSELFGKEVVSCLIDTQKTMGNMLMSQNDNFKISFYPQNSDKPSLIIECKKLTQHTLNGEEAKKINSNCIIGKTYNMYVGEIIK